MADKTLWLYCHLQDKIIIGPGGMVLDYNQGEIFFTDLTYMTIFNDKDKDICNDKLRKESKKDKGNGRCK
jgi:hypothetical protein